MAISYSRHALAEASQPFVDRMGALGMQLIPSTGAIYPFEHVAAYLHPEKDLAITLNLEARPAEVDGIQQLAVSIEAFRTSDETESPYDRLVIVRDVHGEYGLMPETVTILSSDLVGSYLERLVSTATQYVLNGA